MVFICMDCRIVADVIHRRLEHAEQTLSSGNFEKNNIAAKYSFSSIKMGIVSYRSCINISFTGNGIILEAMKIFSIRHKPLFIPYNKIQGAQKGKAFSTYITFTIENKKITIFGKAGEKLFSRLSSGDTTEKNITTHY